MQTGVALLFAFIEHLLNRLRGKRDHVHITPTPVLAQFFPVEIQGPATDRGAHQVPHRLAKALASQGMAHSLNQAQWDWWDFHAIQENTRPWKPWGILACRSSVYIFFLSSSTALLRMKQSVIKVTLQQSFKGEFYMPANFHCLFILDILID